MPRPEHPPCVHGDRIYGVVLGGREDRPSATSGSPYSCPSSTGDVHAFRAGRSPVFAASSPVASALPWYVVQLEAETRDATADLAVTAVAVFDLLATTVAAVDLPVTTVADVPHDDNATVSTAPAADHAHTRPQAERKAPPSAANPASC
jgi:hypothetical protein